MRQKNKEGLRQVRAELHLTATCVKTLRAAVRITTQILRYKSGRDDAIC